MVDEQLFLNTLKFCYPSEGVTCYFSSSDNEKRGFPLYPTLIPQEVKNDSLYSNVSPDNGLRTSFEHELSGFMPISINLNLRENEDFTKRYLNRRLWQYLKRYHELTLTDSGITRDLQVWVNRDKNHIMVQYYKKEVKAWVLDRFTLKVRFDPIAGQPYLLIANDRPALMLNVSLHHLFNADSNSPFHSSQLISPSMLNKVMLREEHDGILRRQIIRYQDLIEKGFEYDKKTTRPILTGEMKHLLNIDKHDEKSPKTSKYVKYLEKITWFKDTYLSSEELREILPGLSSDFTKVNNLETGQIDDSKRMLRFGHQTRNSRQQYGINFGPIRCCPHKDVQLIAVSSEEDKENASRLLGYFKNGDYQGKEENLRKRLERYIGTNVSYANNPNLHIFFKDVNNPLPEIEEAMRQDVFMNRPLQAKYLGIYVSPIHKYSSERQQKECYFKIKELFLRAGIPTQCIDARKMVENINQDRETRKHNFLYTLQNMGVAICAKLGGSPWLLDETVKKELIIGIGAFKSDNHQYIGAAFSFDNTGVFNNYSYFQKNEFDELVGAIRMAIVNYTSINNQIDRLIIHYYKKLSMRKEATQIMEMLNNLGLDIPVYVVSINKTESEDIVLFDGCSTYVKGDTTYQSLMPRSGRWLKLGLVREGYRFLLCNNTRCDDASFRPTDGFPFPVKLTICCPNRPGEIDTTVVQQLIEQVYQFSRIYWKSVRQQGLPVTIKYPEMIAEIMPHFDDPTVYSDHHSLWFL